MATVQRIALAYNNIYVVDDGGGRVLIDPGPDYRGAFATARAEVGARLPGLVVATHGHIDHAGLGAAWQRIRVPVGIGAEDLRYARRPQLHDEAEFVAMAAYVRESGAPAELVAEVTEGLRQRQQWAQRASREASYPAAGRGTRWPTGLRFDPFEPAITYGNDETAIPAGLTVLQSPGHTPGNLVVVHEGEGWLFSGDQLLPEITPTPGIQPISDTAEGARWRFRSLPAFEASLARLAAHGFSRCFPGHGEPFDDVAGVIAANLGAIRQRTERVEAELREAGRASLYALADRIYPRAVRRRFWQIVATVQGHLDILEEDGRAALRDGEYEPVG